MWHLTQAIQAKVLDDSVLCVANIRTVLFPMSLNCAPKVGHYVKSKPHSSTNSAKARSAFFVLIVKVFPVPVIHFEVSPLPEIKLYNLYYVNMVYENYPLRYF